MALPSTRFQYSLTLSHVDRGVEASQSLIAARHPSETAEHLTLRVLAWCLLYQEGIQFGAGLSDPDAPDLVANDLTGRVKLWVECGTADPEKLRKAMQHNTGAAVHAVFSGTRRRDEMLKEVAEWKRVVKGFDAIELWTVDPALVEELARNEERRQKWAVTVVGDHLYLEVDGKSVDGAVERSRAT